MPSRRKIDERSSRAGTNSLPGRISPLRARLRAQYVCVSFTILSLSLVIDTARSNGIIWDAVISCEMLRVYKTRPEAYRLAAKYLAVSPGDILMVACHNFDPEAKATALPSCCVPKNGDQPVPPTQCQIRHAIWSSRASPSLPTFLGRDQSPRTGPADTTAATICDVQPVWRRSRLRLQSVLKLR